jgi:hypothetical protein
VLLLQLGKLALYRIRRLIELGKRLRRLRVDVLGRRLRRTERGLSEIQHRSAVVSANVDPDVHDVIERLGRLPESAVRVCIFGLDSKPALGVFLRGFDRWGHTVFLLS